MIEENQSYSTSSDESPIDNCKTRILRIEENCDIRGLLFEG